MEVRYGANKIITKNNAEFTAAYPTNRIKVALGGHEADKVIYIKKKENHVMLYNLGTFSGICYLFYCFLKKYLYFM